MNSEKKVAQEHQPAAVKTEAANDAPIAPEEVRSELGKHILVDGYHIVQDICKSHDNFIYDSVGKREILDFYTSFSTLPIGYNHPKLLSKECTTKILGPALNKLANSDVYTTEYATFVKSFSTVVPEPLRHHMFFIDGGALAVENALKTAFDWKVRKNLAKNGQEKGHQIIHFKEAFHGRSGYTMSLTNTDIKKTQYYPQFSWPRITNPKLKFTKGTVTEEDLKHVIELEQRAIQEIKDALKNHPDDIAALIMETMQGEGGDNHFRVEFLQALRKLADENEFLLIFDEVQAGFGTSGKWWAFEHFGVTPDIFVFGKKTQVCGICATSRIDDVDSVFKVSSRINSTWGGNLADMVRCTFYLDIIKEENLVANAAHVGKLFLDGLVAIESDFPNIVSNARGRGCFLALDFPTGELRAHAIRQLADAGLLVLSSGPRSIRFRPALNLTPDNVKHALENLRKVVSTM